MKVEQILSTGLADPNGKPRPDMSNLLHYTVSLNNPTVVRLLVQHKADVDAVDNEVQQGHRTPTMSMSHPSPSTPLMLLLGRAERLRGSELAPNPRCLVTAMYRLMC